MTTRFVEDQFHRGVVPCVVAREGRGLAELRFVKHQIPFEFPQKQLSRGHRGRYTNFVVTGSMEIDVVEVASNAAPVALRLTADVSAKDYSVDSLLKRRAEERAVEIRWHAGSFWVDHGPAEKLDAPFEAWKESHWDLPFRRLTRVARKQEVREAPLRYFDAAKIKDKVQAEREKILVAASRIMIVDGRIFERCTEPVAIFQAGEHVGFSFADAAPEEAVSSRFGKKFHYRSEAVALSEAQGIDGVEILMPELLHADPEFGATVASVRHQAQEVTRHARHLPIDQILAIKRLNEALVEIGNHAEPSLLAAVEHFVEMVIDPQEAARLQAIEAYTAVAAEHFTQRPATPVQEAIGGYRLAAQSLADLIPRIKGDLAARLYPEQEHRPFHLDEDRRAGLSRASTASEVFRAARILETDPVTLLEKACTGDVDVILVESGLPYVRKLDKRENGSAWINSGSIPELVGVRLVYPGTPDEPVHAFSKGCDPEIKQRALDLPYPSLVEPLAPAMEVRS